MAHEHSHPQSTWDPGILCLTAPKDGEFFEGAVDGMYRAQAPTKDKAASDFLTQITKE